MAKRSFFLVFLLVFSLFLSACINRSNLNKATQTKDLILERMRLEEKLDAMKYQISKFNIPSWVSQLKIMAPEGMTLDESRSYQTTEEVEGFNSIRYVYTGDYDVAIQEAKKIAQEAGIAVSEEFQMAQEIMKQAGQNTNNEIKGLFGNLKGILYSNYSIGKSSNPDNMISIAVEEDGTLEIFIIESEKQKINHNTVKNIINNIR